jgi:phytoene dehydrogenase-like protein/NAD-dependent dihydropyrimidine dehydrogenase PreA subunit
MKLDLSCCTGCGYCVLACPYDALASDGNLTLNPARCTDCNLCVPACPNDCFTPDVPLKPYRPRLQPRYEVAVIGSGLGGLMTAAALAKAGRRVAVFEKLSFPGGRYTELPWRGAAVTTGAWTNLGPRSHIGRFLADLGIDLSYATLKDAGLPEQYSLRLADGRRYASLLEMLPPADRKAWLKAIVTGRRRLEQPALKSVSAYDYIAQFSVNPDLLAAVDALAATASGLSARHMPAAEFIHITLDGRAAGRDFGMPVGGVRAIIKALVSTLRRAGGKLFVRTPASRILVENGTARGITLADGRTVRAEIIIHNGGPARLRPLLGPENLSPDYLARLQSLKGVACAALVCATRRPLFTEAPITITPNLRRVVGIFSPTVLNPTLAPAGLHLADAFFPLYSDDRATELELALADMRQLFPHYDEVVEWAVPMFFTGGWPGAETGQTFGQTGDDRLAPLTPIRNCYLVGMDGQGSGAAGDLIPLGVRRLLAYLE